MKNFKKHISILYSTGKFHTRLDNLLIIRIVLIKLISTLIINFLAQWINIGGSMVINMKLMRVECAVTSCNQNVIDALIYSTWVYIAFSISNLVLINSNSPERQWSSNCAESVSPADEWLFVCGSYH